jgi:hypothetical protein
VPLFECNEITGDPDRVYEDDPLLAKFGPLGSAPALDITVDRSAVLEPYTNVIRVPGGTALLVQTHWPQEQAWSMTVVNDDGSIRWRRCGQSTVVGLLPASPAVLLGEQTSNVAGVVYAAWRELDSSSGNDTGVLDLPTDVQLLTTGSTRFALFGKQQVFDTQGHPQPGPPDDMMRLIDRQTLAMTELPYPPAYYSGASYASMQIVETDEAPDGWFLKQFGDQYPAIDSVFVDGTWTTDPGRIRSLVPIAAFSPYGQGGLWTGLDPLGGTAWTVPDRVAFVTEGPEWHEAGDIDLLSACQRYDTTADGGWVCVSPSLLGVDGESGTILWELPGHRQVQAAADGYALIGDEHESLLDGSPPAAWLMIDTATGQPVDGQAWDYSTFETDYYSMEQINKWVRRDDGIVVAVKDDHVRIWMPVGVSNGTASVSLAT